MQRSDFLTTCSAIVATTLVGEAPPAAIAGIAIPDTPLAKEATAIARAALPPEIFNHSLRTFLFAELIAGAKAFRTTPRPSTLLRFFTTAGLARPT
jgi:hypothetical protein